MRVQKNTEVYTSSDLLRHARISYRQLYHWETKGLLSPHRIKLGSREFKRYSADDMFTVKLIKDLLDEGYALPNTKMLNLILRRRKIEKELKFRLKIEEALFKVSDKFVNPDDIDEVINASLKILGEVIQVNRVYVFEFIKAGKSMRNTYEFCINSESQIQDLQDIHTEDFPWWMERLSKGDNIIIPDVDLVEHLALKDLLTSQDIRSLLAVPMYDNNGLFGFLGFDDTKKTREWNKEDVIIIKTAADIMMRGIIYNRKVNNKRGERV